MGLPSGLVTFLFTDIEASTRLLHELGDQDFLLLLERHNKVLRTAIGLHGGQEVSTEGDSFFVVFDRAAAAIAAAFSAQMAIGDSGLDSAGLRVRMGLHAGEALVAGASYYGLVVHQAARIAAAAHGGQVLLSAATAEQASGALPSGVTLLDLGEHRLKDLAGSQSLRQLCHPELRSGFPPPRSLDPVRHNLPVPASSFIGREDDLAGLVGAVREHRLVTLTGFGGMGKTRLALQAAAELTDGSVGDVWFVDLAAVTDPALVLARVAETIGVRWGLGEPLPALVAALRKSPTLLVLDNLEQVLGCAPLLAELLERAPAVRVLATSREPLRVRGERQVPVPPLPLPDDLLAEEMTGERLSTFAAVRLFVDRAIAVRPDFVVDNTNAPAVATVCARLDGHPLALELAAARLKVLSVEQVLARLGSALAVLTGGSRDMPERHQTLRATIAWSFDALSRDEQLLLTRLAVLPAPSGLEMVEAVCGEDLDVLDLLDSLVDKSLVTVSEADGGPRFGLLVSIGQFATEQTDPTTLTALADRHADHVHATLAGIERTTMAGYRQRHAYVGTELAHVRTALTHRQVHGPAVGFARLVDVLDDTFYHRGLLAEVTALVIGALPTARDQDPPSPELVGRLLISLVFARMAFPVPLHDIAVEAVAVARKCVDAVVRAEVLSITLRHAATSLAEVRALLAELDEAIEASAGDGAGRVDNRHHGAALALRYVDPVAAEEAARASDESDLMVRPVRLSDVLLDRGEFAPALEILGGASDRSLTGMPNPSWAALIAVTRSTAFTLAGRFEESRAAAEHALAQTALTGAPPLAATAALADLERAAGDPQAAVEPIDTVLSDLPPTAMAHRTVVALRWRRVVCLRQLDRTLPSSELAECRDLLASDALYGPRDLLAVLVERAVQVADADLEKAAALVSSVQAHRGRWVLPFGMDADLQALIPRLPPLQADPAHPTEVW